jgi:hypothetical protein
MVPEYAFDLELLHSRRIRSVLIHVDHPRLRIARVEQHLTKESLGRRCIAFGREQKIDGLPGGIYGSIQISVLPFDSNVSFIDAIAFIGPFQVSAAASVQFWSVDLDSTPDTTGVDEQTTFERHLGHVRK